MELEPIEMINGIFGWIYVILSICVGIQIIHIYFKKKDRVYIYIGLTWIGLSTLWLAASISFLLAITTNQIFPPIPYFLIGVAPIPFFLFMWITGFSNLVYKSHKKIIQIIFGIYGILFETIFLYLLFTDPSRIGTLLTPIDTEWGLFMTVYLLLIIVIAIVTGTLFSIRSIESSSPEIRLRGKLLLLAFSIWALGSIIDTIFDYPIIRLLALIVLIIASFLFYITFNLPRFLREKISK